MANEPKLILLPEPSCPLIIIVQLQGRLMAMTEITAADSTCIQRKN